MATTTAARRLRTAAARSRGASHVEHEAKRTTHTSARHKGEEPPYHETDETEPLTAPHFAPGEEPAFVRVAAGLTINLGDFNSLRLDCSVTLPCRATAAAIAKAHEEAAEFVSEKLDDEQTKWLGRAQESRRGR